MSQRHYQVIILGDSLAARLAGVLLARYGVRVLAFQKNSLPAGPWFPSSLLLEQILDSLGGRTCYTAPTSFQVITRACRVEVNGSFPLDEEFRREFPAQHLRLTEVLRQLAQTAERLESQFWPDGILPLYGIGSRTQYASRNLRNRGAGASLKRPLPTHLSEFVGTAAGEFLDTLFAGLAQVPVERLSLAEGALLWAGAVRERSVSASGLDALLRHRYEQFNGDSEDLGAVQNLTAQGQRLTGLLLENGGRCSADYFLIEDSQITQMLPKEVRKKLPKSASSLVATATFPESRFSPLLAPRVLLAGDPPLRLSFVSRDGQVQCIAKTYRQADRSIPEPSQIRQRLADLLPFAEFEVQLLQEGETLTAIPSRADFPGAVCSLGLSRNTLLCHGPGVLPSLGTFGEVLVGFSSANRLLKSLRCEKNR